MTEENLALKYKQEAAQNGHVLIGLPQRSTPNIFSAKCAMCGYVGSVHVQSGKKYGLFAIRCAGVSDHLLTFEQARNLYQGRRVKKKRSIICEPGVYLLEVAKDRYAVQFANTYCVRICENGAYVINSGSRMTPELAAVISRYSPLRLQPDGDWWKDQHGERFQNSCVVNADGRKLQSTEELVTRLA